MMKTLFVTAALVSACAFAPLTQAGCCAAAGPDHHRHITLPQSGVSGQTIVTQENGVRVYRPAPRENAVAAGQYAAWQMEAQARRQDRRAFNAALSAQDDRIAVLEAGQAALQAEAAQNQAGYNPYPQYQYGYNYLNRVYTVGDPRFAGPYGYTVSPRQVPLFIPGFGVAPPPKAIAKRRVKRRN